MNKENQFVQVVPIQAAEDHRFLPPVHHINPPLPINDAVQIKAAEYWLNWVKQIQALRELESLPAKTWQCPGAVKLRVAAIEGEVVAAWGEAQLIRYLDGKTELRGGSKEDRLAAQEWISLF